MPAPGLGEPQLTVSPALSRLEDLQGESAVAGVILSLGAAVPSLLSLAAGCALGGSGGDSLPAPGEGRESSCAPGAVGLISEKPGALAAP